MDAVTRMGEESVGRMLARYALPAIAGFLANALYQLVDSILVGRGVGTDGMAAVRAAYPLSILGMAIGLLVGAGTGNRMSVLLGQGNQDGAERVLGQGLRLSLINAAVLAGLTWLFTTPILIACGCEPRLLSLAIPFARILAIGQLFLIPLLSMGNILRVQGRPVLGLAITLSGNVLNAVLAAVAIFVFHCGVTGAALATAISQATVCTVVILFVQGHSSIIRIRRKYLTRDLEQAGAILTLGAPFGAMQVLAMLVLLSANHGARDLGGTRGMAALGMLNTVAILFIYPSLGVMQAMQPPVLFQSRFVLPERASFSRVSRCTQGPESTRTTERGLSDSVATRHGRRWLSSGYL